MFHPTAAVYLAVAAILIATAPPVSPTALYPITLYAHAKWILKKYPVPIRDPATNLYTHKRYWAIIGSILYTAGLWCALPTLIVGATVIIVAASTHNSPRNAVPWWMAGICTISAVSLAATGAFQMRVGTQIVLAVYAIATAFLHDHDDRFSTVASFTVVGTAEQSTQRRFSLATTTRINLVAGAIYIVALPFVVAYARPATRMCVAMSIQMLVMIPGQFTDALYGPLLVFAAWIGISVSLVTQSVVLPVWAPLVAFALVAITWAGLDDDRVLLDARRTGIAAIMPIALASAITVYIHGDSRLVVLSFGPIVTVVFHLLHRIHHRTSIQLGWLPAVAVYSYILMPVPPHVPYLYTLAMPCLMAMAHVTLPNIPINWIN